MLAEASTESCTTAFHTLKLHIHVQIIQKNSHRFVFLRGTLTCTEVQAEKQKACSAATLLPAVPRSAVPNLVHVPPVV